MYKILFSFLLLAATANSLQAQTREELERQRLSLQKEIDQTEKLLKANKQETKENFVQWSLINNKVNLQGQVVENLNKDVHVLDNNIYTMQLEINKYNRLLDTLKKEYATSMVYAYKNRSNYDFLNFIFAADNFNDAIKRIAYLKSYRNYREMQGQNITRTQDLLKKKIADLGNAKVSKTVSLKSQSQAMDDLASQKEEKDRIMNELKKQGKDLNGQIAAKQRQMKKVDGVIAAAIKKAIADARREAIAKAAAEEKVRVDAKRIADRKAADEKAARDKETARLAEENKRNNVTAVTTPAVKTVTTPAKEVVKVEPKAVVAPTPAAPKENKNVLLNSSNVALNASFERNRGSLPWPVDKGYILTHYGKVSLPSGGTMMSAFTTIAAPVGSTVKSVFDGTVVAVQNIDEGIDAVVIQHGRYFTTYSNINGVMVQKGDDVKTGQAIGKVALNIDGAGAVDFYMANEKSDFDPESWLRK